MKPYMIDHHDNASILLHKSVKSSNHTYDPSYNHHIFNYGDRIQNCEDLNNMRADPVEANLGFKGCDDDSGTETPPLWPRSTSPQHYRSLSPSSRAQAIAKGQKELMEMVSKMPESCYELSLRDLVQRSPNIVEAKEKEEERVIYPKSRNKSGRKVEMMKRCESLDHNGGFLLRMVVVPAPFKSTKKKNKKNELSNGSNKVSPRPSVSDETNGVRKSFTLPDRKDWWKKRRSNNTGSRKSIDSNSSGSSSENRHGRLGCWSFIRTKRKSKSTE